MGSGVFVLNQPGIYLVDADGNVVPLVVDGSREVSVRDDEVLSALHAIKKEMRAIRLMLGHASELAFDEENDV